VDRIIFEILEITGKIDTKANLFFLFK